MAPFVITLYFLDSLNLGLVDLDRVRINHANSIKAAIEAHRTARGKYPSPFLTDDRADLKSELAEFISELPLDPYWKNGRVNRYRYRYDGATYGLLFYLELGPCQPASETGPPALGMGRR